MREHMRILCTESTGIYEVLAHPHMCRYERTWTHKQHARRYESTAHVCKSEITYRYKAP